MEAYQLNRLVSKPDLLTQADVLSLDALANEFPYFQAVKVLKACATRSESDIHLAAAYIGNRDILARLIKPEPQVLAPETDLGLHTEKMDALPFVRAIELPADAGDEVLVRPEDAPLAASTVEQPIIEPFAEVESDQIDPAMFDFGQADQEFERPEALSTNSFVDPVVYPEPELLFDEPEYPEFEEPQFDPEPQIESEPKQETAFQGPQNEPTFDSLDFFKTQKTEPAPTGFALDNLLSKKDKGFGDKIERQKKLIDRFISAQLTAPSEEEADKIELLEKKDLSEKSSELTAEMATEHLAKFFVKQGKIEKAKQIYTFLMQKHPEKSAHYAALIGGLS